MVVVVNAMFVVYLQPFHSYTVYIVRVDDENYGISLSVFHAKNINIATGFTEAKEFTKSQQTPN